MKKFSIWNKCDICGQFISYDNFENGKATTRMITPDSELSEETYETVHIKCLPKKESLDERLN